MELQISVPDKIQPVEWNYEELKSEIKQKTDVYSKMVYTDDQIDIAKRDRANLNKLEKAIAGQRRDAKQKYLDPYTEFEDQAKELESMIADASENIGKQVKTFEDEQRAEKMQKAEDYFNGIISEDLIEYVSFDRIKNDRWGNKTYAIKAIQEDIDSALKQAKSDVSTIRAMDSPYQFETLKIYAETGDLNAALVEERRLENIAKEREEREAAAKAAKQRAREAQQAADREREAANCVQQQTSPEAVQAPPEASAEPLYSATFTVSGTLQQMTELKSFLKDSGLDYKQHTKSMGG